VRRHSGRSAWRRNRLVRARSSTDLATSDADHHTQGRERQQEGAGLRNVRRENFVLVVGAIEDANAVAVATAEVIEPVLSEAQRGNGVRSSAGEPRVAIAQLLHAARLVGDLPDRDLERGLGKGAIDEMSG